ncbi:hypothetical protein [Paenibacillus thiaminolyticus]|uniref:hypothetical protein n=1 Tax=Paenibacillus thiaminolyticus TaxID=49283 RepID=UPI001602DF4F
MSSATQYEELKKRSGTFNQPLSVWVVAFTCVISFMGIGVNTTAFMESAPVERPVASAAYSFVRFMGGAVSPWLAGKLAEWFNPMVLFVFGASMVLLGVLFLAARRKHLAGIDSAISH